MHPKPDHESFPPEMRTAVTATQLASRLCVATQSRLVSVDTASKSDDSPVTVCDFAVQALISLWLLEKHPSIKLVAEETAEALRADEDGAALLEKVTDLVNETFYLALADGFVVTKDCALLQRLPLTTTQVATAIDRGAGDPDSKNSFWILDPIDGTKGFVAGRQYAIALGLMQGGVITGGVLGCPNMGGTKIPENAEVIPPEPPGVVFVAYKGVGCVVFSSDVKKPLDDGKESTFTSKETEATKRKTCTANASATGLSSRYMESWGDSVVANGNKTKELASKMKSTRTPVKVDSMAKYGALVRGDADLYLRFPPISYREKVWDHAAGVAIVEASGGIVTDGEGNALDFTRGRFLEQNGGIVAAANRGLHRELMDALKEYK